MEPQYKKLTAQSATALAAPGSDAFSITAADDTDLEQVTRAVYVGTDGDLTVVMMSGGEVTFTAVSAGTLLPIRVKQVASTGTTAGAIVGIV